MWGGRVVNVVSRFATQMSREKKCSRAETLHRRGTASGVQVGRTSRAAAPISGSSTPRPARRDIVKWARGCATKMAFRTV
jgi:hypothetical protein